MNFFSQIWCGYLLEGCHKTTINEFANRFSKDKI